MIHAEINRLLAKSIGLDARSIGEQAVRRAIESRIAATKAANLQIYLEHLRASPGELQELIENIVVSETWFFRDREAFAAMACLFRQKAGEAPFHILSLPCATGEEPYTIAMAMIDAGFSPGQFRIDAMDISRPALALAREGLYGKNSFRGSDLAFRSRYFTPEAHGNRISQLVRDCVKFQEGNILEAGFSPAHQVYDAIFCRNMLIYFGEEAQDQAIRTLLRCLAADGTLFVGPSETAILLKHGLVSEDIPFAFAYRRKKPESPRTDSKPPLRIKLSPQPPSPFRPAPKPTKAAPPAQPVVASSKCTLDDIRLMADQGRLAEAAQHCERHLNASGPAAETFYLLAVIRDAAGAPGEAIGWYRKVLYLEPEHREAMAHLALLLEQQGDGAGARVLKERLARLDQREAG